MTSFEHLKQMESLDKFMGNRLEANLSDMAEEDEQDSQRRDANIASASTVIDHPTRQNHLLSNIEKQGHKAEFQ